MCFLSCRWSIPSIICLSLLLGFSNTVIGQPVFQWDKTYGGDDFEELHVIRPLSNGDYILGGYTQSLPSGEVSTASCDSIVRGDYWLVRTSIYGDIIWDKRYGGDGFDRMWSLTPTSDGGFLLGGASNSDSTCNKTTHSFGEFDYWVIKIDSLGDIQWEKSYGGSLNDELMKVLELPDGQGFLLAGHSNSPADGNKSALNIGSNDFWVVRIDTIGNIIWDQTFGGSEYEFLWSLTASHQGNFLVGGLSFSGKSGTKTAACFGENDFWILEFDIHGNIQWDKTYGGSQSEALIHIEMTRDSGYLLVGESNSIPSGNKTAKNIGDRDYWLVKVDSVGSIQWDYTYGGNGLDAGRAAHQNEDGNFLIGGISGSNISGDKSENSRGDFDFWLLLIDENGKLQWDLTYGGNDNDGLTDIFPVQDGGIILGGNSASGASGDKTQDNHGANDIWILKTACKINLDLGNDTLVCSRADLNFDVRQANCLDCEYLWEDGSTEALRTINPKKTKDIHLYISSRSGCEFRDSIHIEVMPSPETIYTNNAPPRCHGESNGSILIEAITGGTDPLLFALNGSDLSIQEFYDQLSADEYLLTVEDANGCRLDSNIILEDTPPLQLRIDGGGVFQLGDSTQLKPIFSSSVDTFFWNPSNTLSCINCPYPYAQPLETSNYVFTIIDEKGCKEKKAVTVAIRKDRPIYFPTAFSPNGDGDNEFYRLYPGQGVKNINYFKIFDRWGELIYSRNNWNIGLGELGWDGKFGGKKLDMGQYVYISEIEFIDGWVEQYKGYFILVR